VLCCYSWGWGRFGRRLVDQLWRRHGLEVELLCLIDPVPYFFGLLSKLLCLTRLGAAVVPRSVKRVGLWRQVNKRAWWHPVGRPIDWDGDTTHVAAMATYGSLSNLMREQARVTKDRMGDMHLSQTIDHMNIDDQLDIRQAVAGAVHQTVSETGASQCPQIA
jgi:hypothetical protein